MSIAKLLPAPKPVEIHEVTARCATHVDLMVEGPLLDVGDKGVVWAYARYQLRSIPIEGDTLNWEQWKADSMVAELWRKMELLPASL